MMHGILPCGRYQPRAFSMPIQIPTVTNPPDHGALYGLASINLLLSEEVRQDLLNLLPGAQQGPRQEAWNSMCMPSAELMQQARATLELAPGINAANGLAAVLAMILYKDGADLIATDFNVQHLQPVLELWGMPADKRDELVANLRHANAQASTTSSCVCNDWARRSHYQVNPSGSIQPGYFS